MQDVKRFLRRCFHLYARPLSKSASHMSLCIPYKLSELHRKLASDRKKN